MRTKLISAAEAVSRIPDGASVAVGGSLLRRQPMVFVREMVRQSKRDLHLLTWATTLATDMLAAAGAVRRWDGIYAGFFRLGLAPNFRRAAEEGRIETHDYSESAMVARFRARAMGLDFLPNRALLGTGMEARSPDEVKRIACPFTGKPVLALKAADADFTILHGYVADEYGNVQWPVVRDSDDIDQMMASASRRLFVSVERIVPHAEIARRPALTYIPHALVEGIVHAPHGAHPTATDGFYDEDEAALEDWLSAARNGSSADWLDRNVRPLPDHEAYLKQQGGEERLSRLDVCEREFA
ncbi:CoA-transferase [Chelativorans sp. AA-79]|uniref:CoA transferase subunit A n=1 Tax=Chelativorans sp. AA-79 TaxID=3028735 RepID=UPI0023F8D7A0|nr:CoA-transferase [Chelativorans sp. AA-79]WEX07267.1 CoA-transferase [Chelativorans sp. AA-79]